MTLADIHNHPLALASIWCIGRNYAAHIEELGNARPDSPVIFSKPQTAVNTDSVITLPEFSADIHYETELVVRIGRGGRNIHPEDAQDYIAGWGIGLDLTARDVQEQLKAKGLPWERCKGFDGAAWVSPFLPAETFSVDDNIEFTMALNGEPRQHGCTQMMIWPIRELIAVLSRTFTLREGDLLFTGTPEGVGRLQAGDKIVLTLGSLTRKIVVSL